MAVVTRPRLVTWRRAHVRVETAGELTRGVAVTSFEAPGRTAAAAPGAGAERRRSGAGPPCEVAVDVDAVAASRLVVERLAVL